MKFNTLFMIVCVWVTHSCLTLGDPMNCSPPGFSVHRIFQTRILEWVASPFSRGEGIEPTQGLNLPALQEDSVVWDTREANSVQMKFNALFTMIITFKYLHLFLPSINIKIWKEWNDVVFSSSSFSQMKSPPTPQIRSHVLILFGEGHDSPLHYSCLENPMDREAWWAMVLRFSNQRLTRLNQLSMHALFY